MGLTKWIRRFGKTTSPDCLDTICSQGDFHALLDLERDRSHRTGDRFSLVVFDSAQSNKEHDYACPLIKLLNDRIRSIDRVGWADKWSVGVLLPETSPEGAHKFADYMAEKMREKGFPINSHVYAFPSEWLVGLKGRQEVAADTGESVQGGTHPTYIEGKEPAETAISAARVGVRRLPLWKRCMDVFGATFGLIVLSPLFLLVCIYIKIVSPGPAFFKQKRVGCDGLPFEMWKFRSMFVTRSEDSHREHMKDVITAAAGSETLGPAMSKLRDDPRIIPFGRLLRNSCIDELPQLINVLRGEMSLVGPRPPIPYEVAEYLRWHNGRFNTVPGMTGLWQVSGKNRLSFKEMVRLDIRYAKECSFGLDVKILLKTPLAILDQTRDDIQGPGFAMRGVGEKS